MCRVLLYLGKQEVAIYDLLYGPNNSLAHQSYAPRLMHHIQNLAGLGFCAWSKHSHDPHLPFYYRTTQLPFFDKNLYRLSKKITSNCVLAHFVVLLIAPMRWFLNKMYILINWITRNWH